MASCHVCSKQLIIRDAYDIIVSGIHELKTLT